MLRAHEIRLTARLLDWLRQRDDVRLIGPDDPAGRAPTISVLPLAKDIASVHRVLTEHKVMTGFGHFYGVRPLMGMDIEINPGVLRFSFIHYTTEAEIDQLIGGLEAALG